MHPNDGCDLYVSFHVQREMVTAREAPVAVATFKGLSSSVLTVMPGQLIASCETPFTSFPGAFVGLFT